MNDDDWTVESFMRHPEGQYGQFHSEPEPAIRISSDSIVFVFLMRSAFAHQILYEDDAFPICNGLNPPPYVVQKIKDILSCYVTQTS